MGKTIALAACAVGFLLIVAGFLGPDRSRPRHDTSDPVGLVSPGSPILEEATNVVLVDILEQIPGILQVESDKFHSLDADYQQRFNSWFSETTKQGDFLSIKATRFNPQAVNLKLLPSIRLIPGHPPTLSGHLKFQVAADHATNGSGTKIIWFYCDESCSKEYSVEFDDISYSQYSGDLPRSILSKIPTLSATPEAAEDDQIIFGNDDGSSTTSVVVGGDDGKTIWAQDSTGFWHIAHQPSMAQSVVEPSAPSFIFYVPAGRGQTVYDQIMNAIGK